ncbi:MAG: SDR family NAD(P)-dependent oxidoreductase [Acidobacteriaceae bacterium]
MMMTTDRKTALITGAARGIGAATARVFARNGYAAFLVDVLDEGKKVSDEINHDGGESTFMLCDVSNEEQVSQAVSAMIERYGHIDALVNIAGIVLVKPFDEISWAEYQRTFDVNVGGTFLMCKYVLPHMKGRKSGAIVNMASVSGHVGQTDHVMYGATKGAILAMARALAWELAPYNIRVNTISPGSVDTPMLRSDIDLESRRTGIPFEAVKKEREAEQAFKRWADPSEIAEPIFFLASDGASFMTGTDVLVDCGWVAK